jgi:EpsD family peptidyl-prolyl cis-trans isomerase
MPLRHLGLALLAALALAGCGDKKTKAPATQTAAKVNKEEITVHQINAVLQQQRGLKAEQLEAAGRQALERLIDQELALQAAAEIKLDRDPRVAQMVEAARREVIARAYAEKLGEGASQSTPADVKQYYDEHPALFKERRVYQFQEINVQAAPEQVEALRAKLIAVKSNNEFIDHLRKSQIQFTGSQFVRGAEQVPLAQLDAVARMKDGEMHWDTVPGGARVTVLVNSRSQPVSLERATPLIEQFLLEQRKRELVSRHLRERRAAARIEYVGKYAASAPEATAPAPAGASAPVDGSEVAKGFGK